MKRWDIINHLIKTYGYKRYLEIGLWEGECFEKIQCENKTSVDPEWNATHKVTSDQFFGLYVQEQYDLIFIDGDHNNGQPEKDLVNSMRWLAENGTIVMHDIGYKDSGMWGSFTIAPVIMAFNCTDNEWSCRVVNTDNGCAVIRREKQNKHNPLFRDMVDWRNRSVYAYKAEYMNYITTEEFMKIYV